MYDFSSEILEILRFAGWTIDREFDTCDWIARLTETGFTVDREAKRVLTAFGDLILKKSSTYCINGNEYEVNNKMYFNPLLVVENIEEVQHYEKILGVTLCPLGEANDFALVLLASDRQVYGITGASLRLIGHQFETALNNIFNPTCVWQIIV